MTRWLLPAVAVLLAVPASAADPPARYDIPYRLTDTKHVHVRVKLNGQGPFNFILDTGAPAVFVGKKVADKAGVKAGRDGWGTFDTFEIEGGLKVEATKTRVSDLFQLEGMNSMGLAGVELHGVVGYNVLAQFRITYDFTADKLAFVPLKGFDPPPVKGIGRTDSQGGLDLLGPAMKMIAGFMGVSPNFDTRPRGFLGAEFEDNKGVFVKAVLADGPAAKAGLKAGDQVKSVAVARKRGKARAVEVDDLRDLERAIAEAVAGDDLKVEVARGDKAETVTLTLGKGL